MPGFPSSSSSKIMTGLFKAPQSAGSTDLNIRLFTSAATGTNGLFPNCTKSNSTAFGNGATGTGVWTAPTGSAAAAAAGDVVDLYIGLLQGTNTTINDSCFATTTGAIVVGSSGNTGLAEANYSGYKRTRITSTPTASGGDAFNTVGTDGNGQSTITITASLTFPACVTGQGGASSTSLVTNTIVGFFISTNRQTHADTTPTAIDILAYGALSSTRSITQNDTPVFTGSAITITLD